MAENESTQCGNCTYFKEFEDAYSEDDPDFIAGNCHRYPPRLDTALAAEEVGYEEPQTSAACWALPCVSSDSWCGEWKPAKQTL